MQTQLKKDAITHLKAVVKALRSPKFLQGFNTMRQPTEHQKAWTPKFDAKGRIVKTKLPPVPTKVCYCVEGVMCEVYRQATRRGKWIYDAESQEFIFALDGLSHTGGMPAKVIEYFGGVESVDGGNGRQVYFTALNDKNQWNFKQFAKAIETQYIVKAKAKKAKKAA